MKVAITAEEILAHPGFEHARRAHIDALVRLFRADPLALRMMSDAGVIIMRGFLVGFHFASDPHDRASWPTPGNIRRALVERGVASARRVDDLLALFRRSGYVDSVASPIDRRSSLLVPTAPVIAHDRDHLAAYHRFLLDLFPGRGYEWVTQGDAGVHRRLRLAGLHDLPRALTVLQHDAIRLFLARDAGYLALVLVAQAQLIGDSFTWSSLADELVVARSHLRTLFADAAAAGYVALRPGRGRPIEILPSLWAAYDRFLADVEAGQDALAQTAFAESD